MNHFVDTNHGPRRRPGTQTRCLRTVLFVIFGHPYALVMAAVALWLLVRFAEKCILGDHVWLAGSTGDAVKGVLCVGGLLAVACLSIVHLVLVVKMGWKGE